ncbi:unnamed protein product [Pedinophyceae sp. YPF-701]|nr:unnamed protein product [Pedinophyceae sp. YPF-701]
MLTPPLLRRRPSAPLRRLRPRDGVDREDHRVVQRVDVPHVARRGHDLSGARIHNHARVRRCSAVARRRGAVERVLHVRAHDGRLHLVDLRATGGDSAPFWPRHA